MGERTPPISVTLIPGTGIEGAKGEDLSMQKDRRAMEKKTVFLI